MGVVSLAVSATRSFKDMVFHVCNVALHILHLDGVLSLGHSPGSDMAKLSADASGHEQEHEEDEFQVIWAESVTPEASASDGEEDATPIEEKPRHRAEDNFQGAAAPNSDAIAANMHTASIVSPKVFKQDEATTVPPEDASLPAKAMSAQPIDMGDGEALSSILEQDALEEARFPSLQSVEEEPVDEQEPQPEERYAAQLTNNSRSLIEKPPAQSTMDFVAKHQPPPPPNWSEDDGVKSIHDIQQNVYSAPPFMPPIGTVVMSPRLSTKLTPTSSSSSASHSILDMLSPRPQQLTPKRHGIFRKR